MDDFVTLPDKPPTPEWTTICREVPYLKAVVRPDWQEVGKPPTMSDKEFMLLLASIKYHKGRDALRLFLLDLLADDLAELVAEAREGAAT